MIFVIRFLHAVGDEDLFTCRHDMHLKRREIRRDQDHGVFDPNLGMTLPN